GAEIEEGVTAADDKAPAVTFVPHLVPLDRGILATVYVRLAPGTSEDTLADVYQQAYDAAPFVRLVGSSLPEIKHVVPTNFCDIGWRVDPSGRAGRLPAIEKPLTAAS